LSRFIAVAPCHPRTRFRHLAHIALVAAALCGGPSIAAAKTTESQKWEFSVNSGRLFSAGTQPDVIKGADYTAAQLAYMLSPNLAITGSLGWARSRDISAVAFPKLDIFTYDIGAEARGDRRSLGSGLAFSPFLGAGAGARSYSYRNLPIDTTNEPAGYVSAGGEFGYHRIRVRLELRDYVTGFKPLKNMGGSELRNDMAVMVGLRLAR
jgi:hypothetical protein